jgi:hypothetical protein
MVLFASPVTLIQLVSATSNSISHPDAPVEAAKVVVVTLPINVIVGVVA